jgi:hypothetical protein
VKVIAIALAAAALLYLASRGQAWAAPEQWTGAVRIDDAPMYDAPGGRPMGSLAAGTPVSVTSWVLGPEMTSDNFTWADIGGGRFVHASMLRHSPVPDSPSGPPHVLATGHWADADLTEQILTLYDGDRPVRMSLMNSGRPGPATESHQGVWQISRRVANETMQGSGYHIAGVLFTQYFTDDAEALHLNYWLTDDERGIPRSHGCLGLAYDDAAFAWRFLTVGSTVSVHA